MSIPSSRREVRLIDARTAKRPLITAQLYRDFPVAELEAVESIWAKARHEAAMTGQITGLSPLEHEHWDWRNKADSVEAGRHMLVAVECRAEGQGLMAGLCHAGRAAVSS